MVLSLPQTIPLIFSYPRSGEPEALWILSLDSLAGCLAGETQDCGDPETLRMWSGSLDLRLREVMREPR